MVVQATKQAQGFLTVYELCGSTLHPCWLYRMPRNGSPDFCPTTRFHFSAFRIDSRLGHESWKSRLHVPRKTFGDCCVVSHSHKPIVPVALPPPPSIPPNRAKPAAWHPAKLRSTSRGTAGVGAACPGCWVLWYARSRACEEW